MKSLRIEQVSKHFQGVVALAEVELEVQPGEVLGLIGPNGAGKTTLVNVITGHLRPDMVVRLPGGMDPGVMPPMSA